MMRLVGLGCQYPEYFIDTQENLANTPKTRYITKQWMGAPDLLNKPLNTQGAHTRVFNYYLCLLKLPRCTFCYFSNKGPISN